VWVLLLFAILVVCGWGALLTAVIDDGSSQAK
jgi:hypothetical protein